MKVNTRYSDEKEHRLRLAEAVNANDDGKTSNYGSVTLTVSTTTTAVTDRRAGINSVVVFQPTTANAAAEVGNGTMYISSNGKETFTITHANNAQADRTFKYIIVG